MSASNPPEDAVQLADGVGIWAWDSTAGKEEFSTNGAATDLPTGAAVSNPAVDSDTGEVAYASLGANDESDTVVVAGALNGDNRTASTGDYKVSHVMGVNDGVVVFNGVQGKHKVVGTIDVDATDPAVETPWTDLHAITVSAIDPQFAQFAAFLGEFEGRFDQRVCTTMFTFAGEEEWASCQWRPVEFSTDGSMVLALGSDTEGFGPRRLAVLDADTGAPLAAFTTPGTFGRATFEGDDVVTVLVVDDQSAIVRCALDGSCELATEARHVRPYEPDSLITPYQLTAN